MSSSTTNDVEPLFVTPPVQPPSGEAGTQAPCESAGPQARPPVPGILTTPGTTRSRRARAAAAFLTDQPVRATPFVYQLSGLLPSIARLFATARLGAADFRG